MTQMHLISFPHTVMGDDRYTTCAYTSKVSKFCKMGWDDLIVYATEGSNPHSAELVECISAKERNKIFGRPNPKKPPEWPTEEQWRLFCERAALEVASRSEPGDLLLLAGGYSQHIVAEWNPHTIACEPGVGYEGIFSPFVAFESYAWQHFIYGKYGMDGRWFDTVIPNYFDLDEFPVVNKGKGDHLLYVGRVVQRKGLQAAMDIATAAGLPLKVAGPGVTKKVKGKYLTAPEVTIYGDVEYLGVLGPKERNEAMADALAVLAPTVYVEPFGGVAVEAMLSGTPVIATDWGAFTETVIDGVTGFRFRTLQQAVDAVSSIKDYDAFENRDIRTEGELRYSLDAVMVEFAEWFESLSTLRGKGWYELR